MHIISNMQAVRGRIWSGLLEKLSSVPVKARDTYFNNSDPTKHYEVITTALNEATEEPSVVYRAKYGDRLTWVQLYSDWSQYVEKNGQFVRRFEKVLNVVDNTDSIDNTSNSSELLEKLSNVPIDEGDVYFHNSDATKHYEVITVALDNSTGEPCVVYKAKYDDCLTWVRLYSVWSQYVEKNGQMVKRFEKVPQA